MTRMHQPLPLSEARPVPHGATARRIVWPQLPVVVRRRIEERLGSPVAEARTQDSGFTPGFASRLTAEDGRRVFVKAASLTAQRRSAASYAREARTLALLPAERLPLAPLLWCEEVEGWYVVALADVEGRPPRRPWVEDDLRRCLDALAAVHAATSGAPAGDLGLAPLHEEVPTLVTGWDEVAAAAPEWPHLAELRQLARAFAALPDADHFVHADARDDNFLLTDDGGAVICDWGWPGLGPRWVDAVALLASARAEGVDAGTVLAEHPLTSGVPAEDVDAWLAALCGCTVESDLRPVPTSSPYLGVHRRWQAAALWDWLAERRGWAPSHDLGGPDRRW